MPTVPLPVPANNPPLATPEALKPKPPELRFSGCDKDKLVMEVVAKVEVPLTFKVDCKIVGPETVKAVAEALPKLEVAVATMEVKDGLLLKVIWVEVPIKTCWPPVI